jgi:Ca2+-binding RTX toxin-like protein
VHRSTWPARIGLPLLVTIAAGAFAAPAQAATAGTAAVTGTTKVQYKAGKGKQNKVVVTRSGNTITIDDKVTVKPGKGCKAVKGDKTKVRCTTKRTPTRVGIYTYDRNDTVVNKTGLAMTADGGTGNDTLTGGPRGDSLRGDSGADRLYGLAGSDGLDGEEGNDRLYGADGNDHLDGSTGNDTLYGGNDHDYLTGMAGNDKEYGGAGVDLFWETSDPSGPDADLLSGGSGSDTVAYTSRSRSVTADADGVRGDDGARNEHDTIGTDVEVLSGGDGADRLVGTNRADVLVGARGNDTLIGGGGNDVLAGEQGRDHLNGGAGNDTLAGDDAAYGTPVADVLIGGSGRDKVSYSDYTKPVTVDLDGAARDDGQAGEHDTVGADVEDLDGGAGSDRLTGNAAANTIYPGGGNNIVHGGPGNDIIEGGDGRDRFYGEAGDDELSGQDDGQSDFADLLDGGANATAAGDICQAQLNDTAVNCERDRP